MSRVHMGMCKPVASVKHHQGVRVELHLLRCMLLLLEHMAQASHDLCEESDVCQTGYGVSPKQSLLTDVMAISKCYQISHPALHRWPNVDALARNIVSKMQCSSTTNLCCIALPKLPIMLNHTHTARSHSM